MALKPRHLLVLAGQGDKQDDENKPRAPLPEAWGVLYAPANPDASRKACENCAMFQPPRICAIHSADVEVGLDFVCGYHVYGQPNSMPMGLALGAGVEPEYSGLVLVTGGTSCDICKYYEPLSPKRGVCSAVVTPEGVPAPVEALGCCSRWESRDATEEEHE